MNQNRAWELLRGLKSAMDSVNYNALVDALKKGELHSWDERDAILAGLRQFVRENVDELGLLQRVLLPDDVHTEYAASDYLEEDHYVYLSPWRQFWRHRDQPLVKCLLLLVGEGFTRFPELSAFESEIPELMEQIAGAVHTLPVDDEGADQTASGSRIMSKALLASRDAALRAPKHPHHVEPSTRGLGQAPRRHAAVTAMLDRLLHRAHLLKCGPNSWRTRALQSRAENG